MRSRGTWHHVSHTSERKRIPSGLRVISSQFWDSNGLIFDLWSGTTVKSGTQSGICYGIAFHCSVMVVWAENSLGTWLTLSDTSWQTCSSLVPISPTMSSPLVSHQFMSNHFKEVIWNETWIYSLVNRVTIWSGEVKCLELLVLEDQ
jgi:hypothetical protein